MTSKKLDIEFVKFVKNKKHAKPDIDDLYEIDFLGRKKEGISFNDTKRNEVKKLKIKEGELSLSDFLSKNINKIIEEPKRKENKENDKKKKEEEKESEDEEENLKDNDSYNESEDYSEDKINHYIGRKRNITNEIDGEVYPHLLEIRIIFNLNFKLLKNETDKSEFDCPEIFYAQFF